MKWIKRIKKTFEDHCVECGTGSFESELILGVCSPCRQEISDKVDTEIREEKIEIIKEGVLRALRQHQKELT